jgi:hypothetical protein
MVKMLEYRLTKSAFKIGRSCPTKLFYYQSQYPSTTSDNSYIKYLADGGFIVGKIARLCLPGGVEIQTDNGLDQAAKLTAIELEKESVILYEAVVRFENKLILIDILEKCGNEVKIIEVKSKSYASRADIDLSVGMQTTLVNSHGDISPSWRPYLEDIAFQAYVFSLAYPQLKWTPYLYLPDKNRTTQIDHLASYFSLVPSSNPENPNRNPKVEFLGDSSLAESIKQDSIMTLVDVTEETKLLWEDICRDAEALDRSLSPALTKIAPDIGTHCAKCEYRVDEGLKSGFQECWGTKADSSPHVFDLYFGTSIQDGALLNSLIKEGKTSLFDIPIDTLRKTRGARQSIQITHTKSGSEWFSPHLRSILTGVNYPLYFIDFETSRFAIPYHANMRPFEQVAFQWSCHTLPSPSSEPIHTEWINTADMFPNFEFAETLRNQIGDSGTILTWAHHERSVLRDIVNQLSRHQVPNQNLANWLLSVTDSSSGRILDLNKVCLDNYFHPAMKGKTSLKAVLPAVWNHNAPLHDIPWLKKYVQYDDDCNVVDPYKTLPTIDIAGKAELIREGTGAMRAYQDMLYGSMREASQEAKEGWRRLLLQYCELDTIAMLIIWRYWEMQLGIALHT